MRRVLEQVKVLVTAGEKVLQLLSKVLGMVLHGKRGLVAEGLFLFRALFESALFVKLEALSQLRLLLLLLDWTGLAFLLFVFLDEQVLGLEGALNRHFLDEQDAFSLDLLHFYYLLFRKGVLGFWGDRKSVV